MLRYLISLDDGSMDHIPARNMPAVGESRCPRGPRRWCGPPESPACRCAQEVREIMFDAESW